MSVRKKMPLTKQPFLSAKLLTRLQNIPGFLADDEAGLLYRLAGLADREGAIVEIGSWQGKSTACLALGARSNTQPVFAVDPHHGRLEGKLHHPGTLPAFLKNIKLLGLEKQVTPIIESSARAAVNFGHPVALLFVDGDHRYRGVTADFRRWSPKIVHGGLIAFHDTLIQPGVRQLVNEKIFRSEDYQVLGFVNSIVFARKAVYLRPRQRFRNYYLLLLHEIFASLVFLKGRLPDHWITLGKRISVKMQ